MNACFSFFLLLSTSLNKVAWAVASVGCNGRRLALRVVEFEVGADNGPLHALEESLDVGLLVRTVLRQVSVLPHVNAHDGCALDIDNAVHQGVVLVIRLSDQ